MSVISRAGKRVVRGTPLETPARWLSRRLRPSVHADRYDALTIAVMERVLKPGSVCVDVGAHRAGVLTEMMRIAWRGQHHAFEPIPWLAASIREIVAREADRAVVHEVALADTNGRATFHHVMDDPGYSGLRQRHDVTDRSRVELIEVETARLDDVLPPDLHVEFIKIDVEGAELSVLRGARRTIERWKPFIAFEHGSASRLAYGVTSAMVWDELVDGVGYEISRLDAWIRHGPPFTRERFVGGADGEWFFLAHPRR